MPVFVFISTIGRGTEVHGHLAHVLPNEVLLPPGSLKALMALTTVTDFGCNIPTLFNFNPSSIWPADLPSNLTNSICI